VLVTPDSRVVLIDFSAATLARDSDARDGEGTLQYMAPEQTGRTGRVVDTRSDHYALGVTSTSCSPGASRSRTTTRSASCTATSPACRRRRSCCAPSCPPRSRR
jgi:serine/threonine protein kinase